MKIPAFWSQATVEEIGQDGKKMSFSCWRSSDASKEAAHESALTAAKRIVQSLLRGEPLDRYAYGSVPMREEVIENLADSAGGSAAAVTRNAYGSLVLNTAKVMFIDLDFPPTSPGESLRHFFKRLFNKSLRSPEVQREYDVMDRLERFISANPEWTLRVYRTRAGLRALAIHDLFDPCSEATLAVFESLGADPLYVRLCKAQECFRARLTPKPWRCGHRVNTIRWPRDDEGRQGQFEKWLSAYTARQAKYGTCRFLGTPG